MLRIKVEATSANICVGFDTLGMALDISNVFCFEKNDTFSFEGFEKKYSNENNNLVVFAYKKAFEYLKKDIIPVKISFSGDIPVSRGMGSSSSLIVAGVCAANYFTGNTLSKDEIFSVCANIEGHPDNVAPAIYGSLVASFKHDDKFYPNIYDVSNRLKFGVIIPDNPVSTNEARGVLPKSYKREDIVNNLSRIVNIPRAFEYGDLKLIKMLFNDKIHEPYRKKLIKEYDDVKNILDKYDTALAISGSGSTMLVISYDYSYVDELLNKGYNVKRVNVGKGVDISED